MLTKYLPDVPRRFLTLAWAKRFPISAFVVGVTVVALGVSLLLPKWYASSTTLLPPAEGTDAFGIMSGLIESSALNRLGLLTTSTPSDVFAEILRSRTLSEELISRFELERLYKTKNLDLALRELSNHIAVDVSKAGLIIVRVEDQDPERAAAMANHLVAMLDRFNRETYSTKAKRTREFLEARLIDVASRLGEAESTLTSYERRNKVIATSENAAIDGIASIVAQKMNLQVRRSYVSSYSTPKSPKLREIDAEMSAIERELSKFPGLKQEGARLALDAEIQRKVFTLLTAQYEEARVQETRDTPTVTVLDVARPPILKSRPRRAVIVVASAAAAALAAGAWLAFGIRDGLLG